MKTITCIFFLAAIFLAHAAWTPNHQISGEASKQLSDGIKAQLYNYLHLDLLMFKRLPINKPPKH